MKPIRIVTITEENKEESRQLKAIWLRKKKAEGLSQEIFGDTHGIGSQAAVGFFLNGKSALSMKAAVGFAQGLNCTIAEFSPRLAKLAADNAAVAESGEQAASRMSNVIPSDIGVIRIPVISYVQAGVWTEAVENFQPGDADDWLFTAESHSKHTFALEIKGPSMLPEFKPGDKVIIDPDVAPNPGDYVVAKNGHEEATFKKYRLRGMDAQGNTIFELVPLNDDFETIRSDTQPIKIIGTMVEHRKYRSR